MKLPMYQGPKRDLETSPTRKGGGRSGGTSPPPNRSFGIEVSYSSTILFFWVCTLAILTWQYSLKMQSITLIMLAAVSVTAEHGETRVLMPLVFFSEQCLDVAMGWQNSSMEFYASTLLSILTLLACKAERRGKSAKARNVILEAVVCGAAGITVVYFIISDKLFSVGAAAYVAAGHTTFLQLMPMLGENEAVLVSSIVGFFIGDVFTNNNISTDGGRESFYIFNAGSYSTSYTHILSRAMILSAIYLTTSVTICSRLCLVPINKNSKSTEWRVSRKRITFVFWVALVVVLTFMYYAVSYQFRENAILWTVAYIGSSAFRTWTLILWVTLIPIAVVLVDLFTRGVKSTVRRKLFHFIGVIGFTPVVLIDPVFFAFAVCTATSLCIVAEVGRFFQVYGSSHLSEFLKHHIDERETVNEIVRSHMYLIFGMGASLILHYRHVQITQNGIPAIMELAYNLIPGIISLGVIDSAAAIVGSSFMLRYRKTLGGYLKNKLFTGRANPSISHKTTTGTIGGFIAGLLFWILILKIAEVPLVSLPTFYTFLMIAAATLTECFMDGIDNLQLPLVMISAICHLFALLMPDDQLWLNEDLRRPNPTTAASLASALRSPWANFKV